MPKPSPKSKEIWIEFIEWLATQEIIAYNDFEDEMILKYQISSDRMHLQENFPSKIAL